MQTLINVTRRLTPQRAEALLETWRGWSSAESLGPVVASLA